MKLISWFVDQSINPRRFKAMPGYQWLIESIVINVFTSGSNDVLILDRHLDQALTGAIGISLNQGRDLLAGFPTNIETTLQIINMDHKTKYLTIGRSGGTTFAATIHIFGQVIKINKIDAIWEFISKR